MKIENIKFKSYKIRHHEYGGNIILKDLTIPEDMKLVEAEEYDIGDGLYDGCRHYVGCYDKSIVDDERLTIRYYYNNRIINDKVYILFDNLDFVDEKPELMTGEEFQKEFLGPNFLVFSWTDDFKLAGITRIKKFVNSCYIECDKLCFPESSRMNKIIFTTTDCTFKSLMSEFLINDFYFQNDPKANFIWNTYVDMYLTSTKIDDNGNITQVSFDKDEPYNLFKEVKELIQIDNDNDNSVLEKIKRIDKILELKN